jgi:hypothetical protein
VGGEVAQRMDRNQSTGTASTDTSTSSEAPGAPALAYVNPQPRLPHSEAAPPEQPETFIRRAKRVRLGSHRLKLWYLALCTYGRAWTRGEDVLEIGIKQRSLAGELETGLNRVSKVLAELRDTGLVHVSRSKYHSIIRIFLTPQCWPDNPETAVTEKAPRLPDTPETAVTEKAPRLPDTPETAVTENSVTPETRVPSTPETGVTKVFRSVLDVQQQHHRAGTRSPTEKQLSGIASMASELGIPAPEPQDRLAADEVFRELRERVDAQRAKRRGKGKSAGPERPHVIQYSKIDRQSRCRVCGAWNPNPRGECGAE